MMTEDEEEKKKEQLFLSYSRADSRFAFRLREDLVKRGFNVWMDQVDIPGGHHWDETIEKALSESRILLVLTTPVSINSQNVRDEVDYAIDEGIDILPLLYKEVKFPLRWRRYQYVVINEKNYEQAFDEVVNSVLRCLGKKIKEPPPPTFWQRYKKLLFLALLLGVGIFLVTIPLKQKIQTALTNIHKEKLPYQTSYELTKKTDSQKLQKKETNYVQVQTQKDTEDTTTNVDVLSKTEHIKQPKLHTTSVAPKIVPMKKVVSFTKTSITKTVHKKVNKIHTDTQSRTLITTQRYDLSKFNNAPYEGSSIVRKFVSALNHNQKVQLKITNHTQEDDSKEMDRLLDVRSWLTDRGIKRGDIEIVLSKEPPWKTMTYEIERK